MVRKPDIQYIDKFFVPGAAAPQIKTREDDKQWVKTVQTRKPKLKILVDPVALCALVVAAAMIALMLVGIFQFKAACDAREEVKTYLTQLQNVASMCLRMIVRALTMVIAALILAFTLSARLAVIAT